MYWVAADGLLLRDKNSTKEAVGTLGSSNSFCAIMRNAKLRTKSGCFSQDLDAVAPVVVSLESVSLSVLAASVDAAMARVAVAWFIPSTEFGRELGSGARSVGWVMGWLAARRPSWDFAHQMGSVPGGGSANVTTSSSG